MVEYVDYNQEDLEELLDDYGEGYGSHGFLTISVTMAHAIDGIRIFEQRNRPA